MPSVSSKQARFMAAVAHNKEFADKAGVPQDVGKEFNDADQSKKKKSRADRMYKPEGAQKKEIQSQHKEDK